jgi:amino acid adenylation domain-containing protein
VALLLRDPVEHIAAAIGTMKAGAVFMTLDAADPPARLQTLARRVQPTWWIAEHDTADVLHALASGLQAALRGVALGESDVCGLAPLSSQPASLELPTEADACYLFFTSGSTGEPKPILGRAHSLAQFIDWEIDAFGLDRHCRLSQLTAPTFDAWLRDVFVPLCAGGTVCVPPRPKLAPDELLHWLEASRVTHVHCVPSLLRAVLGHAQQAHQSLPELAALKRVCLSGEPVLPATVQAWHAAFGGRIELVNFYGASETTMIRCWHRITAEDVARGFIPVGRPIAHTQVIVLDEQGQPCPPGVPGEIWLRSRFFTQGYYGDEARTAEVFVPNPLRPQDVEPVYRTGDLGVQLDDGTLRCLGRRDGQVKVNGVRIEVGEVENALLGHPQVSEAAVVAQQGADGSARLNAYVVATGADVDGLMRHLAQCLPGTMLPHRIAVLDAMPMTSTGKIDRKALGALEDSAAQEPAPYAQPSTETERTVAELYGQVLARERVGRDDDFFALGGHSLQALMVIARIRKAAGVELALRVLFEERTVRRVAQKIDATTADQLAALPIPRRAPDLAPLPLSYAQQRLWFLAQLDARAAAAYAIAGGVRLKGALDVAALHGALNSIVARHEALRTCFCAVDGTPVQLIAPPEVGLAMSQVDLIGHASPEAELERLAAEEAGAPFDLMRGPLIRGRLIRLAGDDHALLVTMHHIVSDGWSMGVLVNEFSALYAAFSQGQPDPLPALAIQYADYAVWQRRWITGEALQRQLDFWRHHLSGAPALLELPTDRPRSAVQDYAGATFDVALDEELTAGLKALSQRHGTTLFVTLLASWAALLARWSGQSDVVIGTPVAHRHRTDIEPLIGCFVNTLALRFDLSGSPTVAQLLAQVRATALAAQEHQDIPFEQVIEALSPQRSLAHSPVFQVVFAWQNAPEGRFEMPGLQLQAIGAHVPTIKFDLELSLQDQGDRIAGHIGYACALFDRTTVERHVSHWQTLLRALVIDDQGRVARLALMSDAEQHQLLHGYNDTAASFPADSCVHELFEAQVQRTPEATALVFDDNSLTYAELNAKANRLAHHLIALGVRTDSRVAIVLPRGIDFVIAVLATLKAGGAYVPLDLNYPAERLHFMLDDCEARWVLTDTALPAKLTGRAPLAPTVLELGASPQPWDAGPDTNPDLAELGLTPSHLAYVIYTSGSTGAPKGVMVAHQSVVKLVMNNGYARFDASDRVAFAANPAFDASTMEIWAPLLHGGVVVVIAQDVLLDAPRYDQALQRHGVTALFMSIGLFHQYAPLLAGAIRQLRYLMVGGDQHDPRVFAQVLRDSPPQHLLHVYGPTETTTFATSYNVRVVLPAAVQLPLGGPIANTRIYILDAQGLPAPVGTRGEIHIGGWGVARGYLKRPDLTAERFIPDPFAASPGARMYKTGDLGRWRPDGTIEFLGRNDHQVKIRGFRVELGDIEAALRSHPEVRDAVVLAREDAPGHKRLVTYVVGEIAPEALRTHLGRLLPEYMLPAAYVVLQALPLTPNGKPDRRVLPAPEADAFSARAYEAPQGEIETTLASIWSELLGVASIGRHDDFFALGGHSLLAVQLTSRIRVALGLEVPLAELFAQPTLAGFAQRVAAASTHVLPAIVPTSRQEALPLSFAQQRLWFLAQLDERTGVAYTIASGVRLKGLLDVAALRAAMNRIVARHEALRTCFGSFDGAPVQLIAPSDVGLALSEADLSGHAHAEAELARLTAEEARAPFDLARGPLIRGCLVRLADDDHALLVTMHHIVSDGWSMGVLVNEFSALYAAFMQGRPDPLPALSIQYADYAAWQRRWITGEVLQRQLDFWRHHLDGAPAVLGLPTDRPRPAVQDYAGASFGFELDAELTANLKGLSQRHGTTLFMTLLASWAALLARLSGQSDVVIGTPVANRHRAEIEPLIGFFVNTQALRVDLSGSPTVADLLAQVRATALAAQAHQDVPFEQVVEAVSPVRSMAHSPVFQVMLAWQNAPEGSLELPRLELKPVGASSTTVKFDLELTLHEVGERIAGSLGYACALFDRATIERHLGHWRTLLRAFIADDAALVARLPLLTVPEQRHLLHSFNDTCADVPPDRCIHQLFEEQVTLTPEATGVVFEGASLTYRELNEQANRLAHHLIALGVHPDSRVAIALPRGINMVVALLATLKAGGAYVPLDPDYPAERLAFMLSDSSPCVLITDTVTCTVLGGMRDRLTVLTLDATSGAWQALPATNPEPGVLGLSPSHLAYVIYTSGSTGQPKGVMVSHRSVVHLWAGLEHGIYAHHRGVQRVSLNASLAFDASVQQWVQLASGRTLVIVPDAARRDAAALLDLIATGRIDALDCTPSQLQLIHSAPTSAAWPAPAIALVGGEAIDPALWHTLAGSTETTYYNVYGPTECTVDSTIAPIQAPASAPHIGRPVANTRIRIVDMFGASLPVGMPGEVCVAGAQVARGYLGRPDLTAERFVPDPFGEAGSRMYRTGDLGRWRTDGTIEFLGRNDHQVKIRGFRIELGEIEAALRSHPEVRATVVLAREDVPGDKRLVAYVVGEAVPEVLRAHLGSRLPEYMVPAAYVVLDALPLTPNGKLYRRALPAPSHTAWGQHTDEAPEGQLESTLATLWAQVLGIERIGRHDSFFDLGGHSLLALQLMSRLSQRLEREVPVHLLFANPSVAAMARRIDALEAPQEFRNRVAVRTSGSGAPLFIIHAGDGEVGYAFDLAPHLPPQHPVYALASIGLGDGETPLSTVEAMAAQYVRAIRDVQPRGPYHLIGWSAGGMIACEMAAQLVGAGESVGLLAVIDTLSDYSSTLGSRADEPTQAQYFEACVREKFGDELAGRLTAHAEQNDLSAMFELGQRHGVIDATIERTTLRRHLAVRHAIALALGRYRPQPFAVPLSVFTAADEDRLDPRLGWDDLAKHGLHVVALRGTHWSIVEPAHIRALGTAITQALAPGAAMSLAR